jgi:hypothetical protein
MRHSTATFIRRAFVAYYVAVGVIGLLFIPLSSYQRAHTPQLSEGSFWLFAILAASSAVLALASSHAGDALGEPVTFSRSLSIERIRGWKANTMFMVAASASSLMMSWHIALGLCPGSDAPVTEILRAKEVVAERSYSWRNSCRLGVKVVGDYSAEYCLCNRRTCVPGYAAHLKPGDRVDLLFSGNSFGQTLVAVRILHAA